MVTLRLARADDADEIGRRIGDVDVRLVEHERRRVVDDRHLTALECLEQTDDGTRDRAPQGTVEDEDRVLAEAGQAIAREEQTNGDVLTSDTTTQERPDR